MLCVGIVYAYQELVQFCFGRGLPDVCMSSHVRIVPFRTKEPRNSDLDDGVLSEQGKGSALTCKEQIHVLIWNMN